MAKFRILHTRKTESPNIALFEMEFIGAELKADDTFMTYDTHHPIKWVVLEVRNHASVAARGDNNFALGWDDQFAGAVVDTEARSRPEAFHY